MIVRQTFEEMPPKAFMMQILDITSKIYLFLWDRKNDKNRFSISWEDLRRYYNKNTFRTTLRRLADAGLVNYDESEKKISVELIGWDDIAEV